MRLKILHICQSTFPRALPDPHKVKSLALKSCRAAFMRGGARLAPLGKWPIESALLAFDAVVGVFPVSSVSVDLS